MQAILLVTVFSCLLAAATAADAGAVGGACIPDVTCNDPTSVCESSICKIKADETCTASPTNCVAQSTCSNNKCTCYAGYSATIHGYCTTAVAGEICRANGSCADATLVCESLICYIKAGRTCTDLCVSHSTCSTTCNCNRGYTAASTGLCTTSGAAGEACKADGSCADSTLVCESSVCKIKAGQSCTASPSQCVSQSTCSTTCNCNNGYTALTTGVCTSGAAGEACKADGSCADTTLVCESSVCKIKAGQTCTSSSTNCVSQSTCVTGTLKCTCGTGYTALTTGLCSGVVPQSVSSWLLTGSIITFLMTLSLP